MANLLERTKIEVLSRFGGIFLALSQLWDASTISAVSQVENAIIGPAIVSTREDAHIWSLSHDARHVCVGLMKFIPFIFQHSVEAFRYLFQILSS